MSILFLDTLRKNWQRVWSLASLISLGVSILTPGVTLLLPAHAQQENTVKKIATYVNPKETLYYFNFNPKVKPLPHSVLVFEVAEVFGTQGCINCEEGTGAAVSRGWPVVARVGQGPPDKLVSTGFNPDGQQMRSQGPYWWVLDNPVIQDPDQGPIGGKAREIPVQAKPTQLNRPGRVTEPGTTDLVSQLNPKADFDKYLDELVKSVPGLAAKLQNPGQPSPTPSNEVTLWCARLEGDEEKGKRYADNRVRNTIVELENTEDDGKTDYPANYQKELITKFNAHRSKFSPTKGFEPLNGSDFSAGDAVTELVRRRIVAEDRNNPEVSSGKRKQITPDKVKFTNLKGGAEDPRCEGRTGPITSDQLLPRAPAGPGTAGAGTPQGSAGQPGQRTSFAQPLQDIETSGQVAPAGAGADAGQGPESALLPLALLQALKDLFGGQKQRGQGEPQSGQTSGREPACQREIDPVCGADGNTYPNRCIAEVESHVPVVHQGACTETPPFQEHPTAAGLGALFEQLTMSGIPTTLLEQVIRAVVSLVTGFLSQETTVGISPPTGDL